MNIFKDSVFHRFISFGLLLTVGLIAKRSAEILNETAKFTIGIALIVFFLYLAALSWELANNELGDQK